MRGTPRINGGVIDFEEEEKKNNELLKTKWWEEISTDNLPYAPRPKGGKRIDFYAYPNLLDMAMEVKESTHCFKHTGDVHRAAHYLGMYLLRKKHVTNNQKHEFDDFMLSAEEEMKRGTERSMMLDRFKTCYDQFINSLMTKDELSVVIDKMKKSIKQDDTRKWFVDNVNSIIGDEEELRKSKNRQQMQRIRAELAGLKVVDSGM